MQSATRHARSVIVRSTRVAPVLLLVLVAALVLQAGLGGAWMRGAAVPLAVVILAGLLGYGTRVGLSLAVGLTAVVGLTLANQLDASTGFAPWNDLVFFAVLVAAPVAIGQVLGMRSQQIEELRRRAALLAREQALALDAAGVEERSRIAIEVHVAIAQRVGEIALQAAGAERIARSDDARALEALARVETSARESLEELRRVIGVLREPALPGRS